MKSQIIYLEDYVFDEEGLCCLEVKSSGCCFTLYPFDMNEMGIPEVVQLPLNDDLIFQCVHPPLEGTIPH